MLLTLPGSIVKTEPASFTLSKSELMALAQVSADSFFSAPGKAKKAIFVFESTAGEQLAFLSFDLSQENPQSSVVFSSTARSSFELKRVILRDADRGRLIISRSALPSGLDLSITEAAQGGGQSQGGGNTPSGPEMITSGLIVRLESETLESGQWGPQWTDAISQRGFFPISSGMNNGTASVQAGAFGSRSGMRLQGGMKMPENLGGSPLLQSAASLTVLVVGKAAAEQEFLNISNNGIPYASLKSSIYYPYMGFGMPAPRASLEAFAEFYSMPMGGGNAEVVTTNSASYTAGTSKVFAFTMPNRSSIGAKFLVNGGESASGAQSGGMNPIMVGMDATIHIGGYFPGMSQDLTVGAVLIYDRLLSDAELSQLSAFMMTRYSIA